MHMAFCSPLKCHSNSVSYVHHTLVSLELDNLLYIYKYYDQPHNIRYNSLGACELSSQCICTLLL